MAVREAISFVLSAKEMIKEFSTHGWEMTVLLHILNKVPQASEAFENESV